MSLKDQFNQISPPRKVVLKSKIGFFLTLFFPIPFFAMPIYFMTRNQKTSVQFHNQAFLIPLVMGSLSGIIVYFFSYRRPKQILETGTMVEGKILQIFAGKNRTAEVEFTPVGWPPQKKRFGFSSLAKVGDTVSVVYDAQDPKKAVLYPAPLVKVESL